MLTSAWTSKTSCARRRAASKPSSNCPMDNVRRTRAQQDHGEHPAVSYYSQPPAPHFSVCSSHLSVLVITLGPERFRCSEPLFRPGLIGLSEHGLDYSLWWWVNRLDRDLHASMFDNIVLAGSGTLFAGFAERLTRCVKMYLKKDATVKVVAPPERKYSAWIGGSIAASLSIFKSMWITKQE